MKLQNLFAEDKTLVTNTNLSVRMLVAKSSIPQGLVCNNCMKVPNDGLKRSVAA